MLTVNIIDISPKETIGVFSITKLLYFSKKIVYITSINNIPVYTKKDCVQDFDKIYFFRSSPCFEIDINIKILHMNDTTKNIIAK